MTKLSIVIPAYNEEKTLATCVERVLAIADDKLQLEIIIVNDASKDGTIDVAKKLAERDGIRLISHDVNQGKGAALRTGFQYATGDIVCVQDADLEYNPMDLKRLSVPIIEGRAEVVYGSRYLHNGERQVQRFWHFIINRIITLTSNMVTNRYFTDVETCYKVFRRDVLNHIKIEESRFGFDPEITAKVSKLKINGRYLNIMEMPASYHWRTHDEGKKIGWKDGVRAIYAIFKYGLKK